LTQTRAWRAATGPAGVAIVAALSVVALWAMVASQTGLYRVDEPVAEWVAANVSGPVLTWWKVVTSLGSAPVVTALLAVVAAVRCRASALLFVAVVGVGEHVIANWLKLTVDRPRPDLLRHVAASGSAFPSGHAAAAAACWAAAALLLGAGSVRRRWLLVTAVGVAVAVAASRVMLGVHWVTDVAAGLAVGWGWCALVVLVWPDGGGRWQLGRGTRRG
jgi:membrane-associated phospholipid phosphatase